MWCSGGMLGVKVMLVFLVSIFEMFFCWCVVWGIRSVEFFLISIFGGILLILCSVFLFMLICLVVLFGFIVCGIIYVV